MCKPLTPLTHPKVLKHCRLINTELELGYCKSVEFIINIIFT